MRFRYFPETDSLYIEFKPEPAAETVEVSDSVLVDLDKDGHVVGLDIDKASEHPDLSDLNADSPPITWLTELSPTVVADAATSH